MKRSLPWLCLLFLLAGCSAQKMPEEEEKRFDSIVIADYVMTMDSLGTVHQPGYVGIRGDTIVEVGRWTAALKAEAETVLKTPGSLVMPGLINGHQHAAMSLLRGIGDDMDLMDWLNNYIFPAESRNVTPEFVYWGTMLSAAEMISSGTTTYVDMYYFEEEAARATADAGMRGILGQTLIDFPAPDYETPSEALEGARRFILNWTDHPLIIPAVAPHAPYTCSPEVLMQSRQLADELDAPLVIHLSETRAEVEQVLESRGARPVQFLENIGFLADRVIAAHLVWADSDEVKLLSRRDVGVIHNPESNMKLASGVAPVPEMLEAGVAIGIGTDGPASNNNLDLFQEMDSMAKLHAISRMEPTAIGAHDALIAATSGGARALNLDDRLGSLETGKKADLIVVNVQTPAAMPRYDLYSSVVYALNGSAVDHVMVNGRWLMRDRSLLTVDLEEVFRRAEEFQGEIEASLNK